MNAAKDTSISCSLDMHNYIQDLNSTPPGKILKEVHQAAIASRNFPLEIDTILKSTTIFYNLTNHDLKRLWHCCAQEEQSDLAWRAASILRTRILLPESINYAWKLSGEQKVSHPLNAPKNRDYDIALHGFAPEESKLAWACLKLGTAIPILLSEENSKIKISRKYITSKQNPWNDKIHELLNKTKWLQQPKKDYQVDGVPYEFGAHLPAFTQILLQNPWCYLVSLIAQRIGIASWNSRISILRNHIDKLAKGKSKSSWQPFSQENQALNKWMKALTAEQKSAWHDLCHLSYKLSDEQSFRILSCFVCRLATLILPDHFEVLHSLKQMRAPIFLVWNIENWILSHSYSDFRNKNGLDHKVPIPKSFQQNPIF